MFSLITDLELLRRKIIEVGNVVTVQIDPRSRSEPDREPSCAAARNLPAGVRAAVDRTAACHRPSALIGLRGAK
jgi:hypothetical protein